MTITYKYVGTTIVHDANIHITLFEKPLQIFSEYKSGNLILHFIYNDNEKNEIETIDIDTRLSDIDLTEIKIDFKKVKNSSFLNNQKLFYASWCNKLKYTENDILSKINYITNIDDINKVLQEHFVLGYFVKLSCSSNLVYAYIYEKTPWEIDTRGCVYSHNYNDLMYKILKNL
jgi:hypothetical protein